MIRVIRNNKGLTLVELVIGMVVLTIILTMVVSIVMPMMQFQRRANLLAEQNSLLDNLANQIIYDISMATSIITTLETINAPAAPGISAPLLIPVSASSGSEIEYDIETFIPAGSNEHTSLIRRSQAEITNYLLPDRFHRGLRVQSIAIERVDEVNDNEVEGIVYMLTLVLQSIPREGHGSPVTFQRDYFVRPLGAQG